MNRTRILVAVAVVVLMTSTAMVYAGAVKRGSDTVKSTQTTNTQTVDITTGTIHVDFNPSFFPGQGPTDIQFTACNKILPTDLLNALIAQTNCGGALSDQTALSQNLAQLRNQCENPTIAEFLTANCSPGEVAFNATSTTFVQQTVQVGSQTFDYGCGCVETIPIFETRTVAVKTTTSGVDRLPPDQSLNQLEDVSALKGETIGGRVASSSKSVAPLGSFVLANVNVGPTGTTKSSHGVTITDSFTSTGNKHSVVTANSFGAFKFSTSTVNKTVQTNIDTHVTQVTGNVFVSPLVLDLQGKGILEASNGNYLPHPGKMTGDNVQEYDYMANGFPFIMEWVGQHDGLLVQPKADGTVDPTCLFSLQGGWDNGYQKLQLVDINDDKKVSGDELKGLSVWVDANSNGIAETNEVKTVQELGITEINLNHRSYKSTFVMNGKTHTMWDWWPTAMETKKMRVADLQQLEADHKQIVK